MLPTFTSSNIYSTLYPGRLIIVRVSGKCPCFCAIKENGLNCGNEQAYFQVPTEIGLADMTDFMTGIPCLELPHFEVPI